MSERLDEHEANQYYNLLIETLEQLGKPANMQIQKLKGTDVTDELALDFCNIGMPAAKKLHEISWITQEQLRSLSLLYTTLNDMSKNATLWTENALHTSAEWAECRDPARDILKHITEAF